MMWTSFEKWWNDLGDKPVDPALSDVWAAWQAATEQTARECAAICQGYISGADARDKICAKYGLKP